MPRVYTKTPPGTRFVRLVDFRGPDECWPWMGAISKQTGYPSFTVDRMRAGLAHRFSYELYKGPIPKGMDIDHTCHNGSGCAGGSSCLHRRCVNPAHLEASVPKQNKLRGQSPWANNARKTHCLRGHEFTPENTYKRIRIDGGRACRECYRIRKRAARAQQKRRA